MTHFKYTPLFSHPRYTFPYFSLRMPKARPVTFKNQLNGTPRKRKSLTAVQKKEICLKRMFTPFLKQKELASMMLVKV